jgi:hypothetical protein
MGVSLGERFASGVGSAGFMHLPKPGKGGLGRNPDDSGGRLFLPSTKTCSQSYIQAMARQLKCSFGYKYYTSTQTGWVDYFYLCAASKLETSHSPVVVAG